MVSKVSSQFLAVGGVLVHTKFDVLCKLLVEFLPAVFVFVQFVHQIHTFFDQILSNDFENLVLLEHLTGNVQGQVLGVDNALNEVEIFRDEFLTVIHDEYSSDIKFDVIFGFLVFE